MLPQTLYSLFFFFNDTATTEIYTLSLHDALPIYVRRGPPGGRGARLSSPVGKRNISPPPPQDFHVVFQDRKSTRLNSSHLVISYAVFCLKKKKKKKTKAT